MVPALIRPHPLTARDQRTEEFPEGLTLAEMVAVYWPGGVAREYVVVFVGNRQVPAEYWARVRPKAGVMVRMALTLGGGDGDKQMLGLVAMIALSIVAPMAGAAIFGAGTFGATAFAVGVTIVGSLAIGALFKPPAPTAVAKSPQESATYALTGQSNQVTPYGVVPRAYGTNRIFPLVAASPYAGAEGPNHYLYMLMDCGYGPLEIEQLRIGDTGIENFSDVQYDIHPAWRAGDALTLYKTDINNESFNITCTAGHPQIRVTTPNTSHITCEFACPRGLVTFDDRGNRQQAFVDIALGFRPLGSTGAFVPLDAVKVSTARQVSTVLNVGPKTAFAHKYVPTAEAKYWSVNNPYALGFFAGDTSLRVCVVGMNDVELGRVFAGDTIYFLGNPYAVTAVGPLSPGGGGLRFTDVFIDPPLSAAGMGQPPRPGFGSASATPGLIAQSVQCPLTRSAPTGEFRVLDSTAEPLYFSVGWDVAPGQYEVQVTRLTPDNTLTTVANDLAWLQLRSASDRPPIATREPHTIIEMKIKANDQLSGVISNLNCIATAVLPVWDDEAGAFVERPTRNPAWAYLDVLRGNAALRPLADARIDFDSLRAWAAYCDADVPNGINGFTEQRVCFDHVVDYSTTTFSTLQSIASAGRATPTIRDGKHAVLVDEEQTVPVQLFTPRNSWGFNGTRSYVTEPNGLRVKFIDPNSWQESEVVIYAAGYNENNAATFEELKLLGVTRYSQATRDGRYMKAQAMLRREQFTIQCDIESLIATRGDLVVVQHDVLQVGGESSRIASVSGASITLVDPFGTLAPGRYGVRLRLRDGTITPPIEATPSAPDTFMLSSVPTPAPAAGDLLAWGTLGIEAGEYLVKNIAPGPDFTATISLVEVARDIYHADTGFIPAYVPPAGARPEGMVGLPAPTNLTAQQVDKTVGRQPYADVVLNWDAPSGAAYHHYRVARIDPVSGVETAVAESLVTSALVAQNVWLLGPGAVDDITRYSVIGVDVIGNASQPATIDVQLADPRFMPDAPGFLSSNLHDKTTTLTWIAPAETNNPGNGQVMGFEIRWAPFGTPALWGTASRVTEIVPWNTTTATVPSRNGAYLVKAVTASGIECEQPAVTVTAVDNLVIQDVVDTFRFNPEWIGHHDGTEIDAGGRLVLQKDASSGAYIPFGVFYSHVREAFNQLVQLRINALSQAFGASSVSFMDRWVPLSVADPLAGAIRGVDWDVSVWVFASRTPYVMADWVPLSLAVPLELIPEFNRADWRPVLHGEYIARACAFAVVLQSQQPTVTPVVQSAGADIDFPERTESYADIAVPAGGLDFLFTWPFVFPPSVAVDLQGAAVGDRVVRGAVGTGGFHVQVMNGATGVPGVLDIHANGVGRLLAADGGGGAAARGFDTGYSEGFN
jgi:hypothetical protein